MPDANERARALLEVGRQRAGAADAAAVATLTAAAQVASAVDTKWQRAETLCRIGSALWVLGERQQARGCCRDAISAAVAGRRDTPLQDAVDSSGVLREIAVTMAEAGELDEAERAAAAIENASR